MHTLKYIIAATVILLGIIYAFPNYYGTTPAVQISGSVSQDTLQQALDILHKNNIDDTGYHFDKLIKIKFQDTELQLRAYYLLRNICHNECHVALNLVSNSPNWLSGIHANPMFLGLDLRGGVRFVLTVDTKALYDNILYKLSNDIKRILEERRLHYSSMSIQSQIDVVFENKQDALQALHSLQNMSVQLVDDHKLTVVLSDAEKRKLKSDAIEQNILILHNRVNELGINEPIIQAHGDDEIVVELPGIQDVARARNIIGKTASLEMHLVSDYNSSDSMLLPRINDITQQVIVKNAVEITGDSIVDAAAGFDDMGNPAVNIRLDGNGSYIFKILTRDNIGKKIAIVLKDNDSRRVITDPVVTTEIGGGRLQISGAMNVEQSNDIALLLRSGSLAAPMTIAAENIVGPSLGYDNIINGIKSIVYGFAAIAIFMLIYYTLFGLIGILSLGVNLVLIVAVLSILQATLTLPGMAAIALTLGMAIDANVLINERIREERAKGYGSVIAINNGYSFAWTAILDSNVTMLIAGIALLLFSTGAVRGFAIVHCVGVATSMFSAVFVSRSISALLFLKARLPLFI